MSPYEQKMDSLAKANDVRFAKARRKQELRDRFAREGRAAALKHVASVLKDPAGIDARLRVAELLRCIPGVGEYKVTTYCRRADVNPFFEVAKVTPMRRAALAMQLELVGENYRAAA